MQLLSTVFTHSMAEIFAKYSGLKTVRKEFILPRGGFTFGASSC